MKLWIARDYSDDSLWGYDKKPIRNGADFACSSDSNMMFRIPRVLFPEITFENSPQQVEIKLIEDERDK